MWRHSHLFYSSNVCLFSQLTCLKYCWLLQVIKNNSKGFIVYAKNIFLSKISEEVALPNSTYGTNHYTSLKCKAQQIVVRRSGSVLNYNQGKTSSPLLLLAPGMNVKTVLHNTQALGQSNFLFQALVSLHAQAASHQVSTFFVKACVINKI